MGSRRVEANAVLASMDEIVKHKFPYEDVGYAFLEFAEPNIRDFLEECVSTDLVKLTFIMLLKHSNHGVFEQNWTIAASFRHVLSRNQVFPDNFLDSG